MAFCAFCPKDDFSEKIRESESSLAAVMSTSMNMIRNSLKVHGDLYPEIEEISSELQRKGQQQDPLSIVNHIASLRELRTLPDPVPKAVSSDWSKNVQNLIHAALMFADEDPTTRRKSVTLLFLAAEQAVVELEESRFHFPATGEFIVARHLAMFQVDGFVTVDFHIINTDLNFPEEPVFVGNPSGAPNVFLWRKKVDHTASVQVLACAGPVFESSEEMMITCCNAVSFCARIARAENFQEWATCCPIGCYQCMFFNFLSGS